MFPRQLDHVSHMYIIIIIFVCIPVVSYDFQMEKPRSRAVDIRPPVLGSNDVGPYCIGKNRFSAVSTEERKHQIFGFFTLKP